MNHRILLVDDDPNILQGYQRQLHKHVDIETAQNGIAGLKSLKEKGPFAVIISDLRMPGMDGIAFLAEAREQSPDSVRVMLTGHADLEAAINAVNKGNIFRLLTKPCPAENLLQTVQGCDSTIRCCGYVYHGIDGSDSASWLEHYRGDHSPAGYSYRGCERLRYSHDRKVPRGKLSRKSSYKT